METQTILNIILLAIFCMGELFSIFTTIMTIKDESENIGYIICGAILVAFGYGIYILVPLVQM